MSVNEVSFVPAGRHAVSDDDANEAKALVNVKSAKTGRSNVCPPPLSFSIQYACAGAGVPRQTAAAAPSVLGAPLTVAGSVAAAATTVPVSFPDCTEAVTLPTSAPGTSE